MRVRGIKMTAKRKRLLQSRLGETDEIADPVVGKVHRTADTGRSDPGRDTRWARDEPGGLWST